MESRMWSALRFYLCEWGGGGGGTWTVKTNILASYWELKGRPGNWTHSSGCSQNRNNKKLLQKLFPYVLILLHVRSKLLASDYRTMSKSRNLKNCAYNKVVHKVRGTRMASFGIMEHQMLNWESNFTKAKNWTQTRKLSFIPSSLFPQRLHCCYIYFYWSYLYNYYNYSRTLCIKCWDFIKFP